MRKDKLAQWFIMILFGALPSSSCVQKEISNQTDYTQLVYPFLDAANSRWFYFNTASRPFGMVNLSPDTELGGAWGSGYRYDTDTVKGFSHIHAWQLSGIQVMPVVCSKDSVDSIIKDYYSSFSHEREEVAPGYHRVFLERYEVEAELTSSTRVGFHRYNFPKNEQPGLYIQLAGQLGPTSIKAGQISMINEHSIEGKIISSSTRRRPKDFAIYFTIDFNQMIDTIEFASDNTGAIILFTDLQDKPLLTKVALSYTSSANAALNLRTEISHWDFDKVKEESSNEWNQLLSRVEIRGGSHLERRRFYTDLFHALQGRRIINDVNGAYPDYTGKEFRIGQLPLGSDQKPLFNHYNSDSFWGAQWTINILWGLVYPEIMESFVQSFLQYYQDGGFIPRGPSGGNYTHVMTGSSFTPFLVSAYQKGLRGYEEEIAYQGLKKNHMPGGTMGKAGYEHWTNLGGGLIYYINQGYVPFPIPEGEFGYHQDGASLTMEYAYQDWTLAQFAKALNKSEDYQYFADRSTNYMHVFDTNTTWMRPKDVDGDWLSPFDPYLYGNGFNESNAAQSTWFVPHDIEGLAKLMGGKEKAIEKLTQQFEKAAELNFTSGDSHERESHPEFVRIPINYGNQPSIQTAFIFHHLDRPDLSHYWIRQIVENVYSGCSPYTGYKGDEDQGLMGALAVLMKIGLFQITGGTEENPVYQLHPPWFDEVTIHLNQNYYPGSSIDINKDSKSNNSVSWNDQHLPQFELHHMELINGGVIQFLPE